MKYADDTAVVGLINNDNNETMYFDTVNFVNDWCKDNYLLLNVAKTKELIIDFRKNTPEKLPMTIDGSIVEVVPSYKYLGTHIQNNLKWDSHTKYLTNKVNKRMYFVRCLYKVNIDNTIISLFYNSIVASVMCYAIVCWWNSCTKKQQHDLMMQRNRAVRLTRNLMLYSPIDVYMKTCERTALKVFNDECHPLHKFMNFLPHGARLRVPMCRTVRYKRTFVPQAIDILNSLKPWTLNAQ